MKSTLTAVTSSGRRTTSLLLVLCIIIALTSFAVTVSAASTSAASTQLQGDFIHQNGTDRIQAAAPKTVAICGGYSSPVDESAGFYALLEEIVIVAESNDAYSVSPTHPSCLGANEPWRKLTAGHVLVRRCNSLWLTIIAVEAEEAKDGYEAVSAGIMVTIQYADGSYCSTHMSKEEAEAAVTEATADWETWVYSFIGVGISSIVSLIGVTFLMCNRASLRHYLLELMGLSCGTFLGSIIFSLLPETALEIGLKVEVTSVILGGILFGMLSETLLHGGVHYFTKKRADEITRANAEAGISKGQTGGGSSE